MTQPDTLARLRYVAKNRTSRYGIPISELGALLDIAEAAQRAKDFADEKAGELARVGNWYEAKQLTIIASNLDRALAALDAADHE